MPADGTSSKLTSYAGTVAVPALGPVSTSQLVTWTDGDAVPTTLGKVRTLPKFFVPSGSAGTAGVQPVSLTLTSSTAIDEQVHLLGVRFTFYGSPVSAAQ